MKPGDLLRVGNGAISGHILSLDPNFILKSVWVDESTRESIPVGAIVLYIGPTPSATNMGIWINVLYNQKVRAVYKPHVEAI